MIRIVCEVLGVFCRSLSDRLFGGYNIHVYRRYRALHR